MAVVSVNADATITYQPDNDFAGEEFVLLPGLQYAELLLKCQVHVDITEDNCAANSYKAIPTSAPLVTTFNATKDNF
jgi:hypothetical protein